MTPAQLPAPPTDAQAAALAAQGARPGDDQMTCAQIGAELQPYTAQITPVATDLGAQAQAIQKKGEERRAQAMAQAPVNMAAAAAASLLPGGGAIAQAQMAAQYAQAQRQAAEDKPMVDKFNATAGQLSVAAAPMMSDPRVQRLMQLADQKCKGVR
jgi:hypothetical protein